MTIYNYLPNGCLDCPFSGEGGECDQGAGYTSMDEHGECPVEINEGDKVENLIYTPYQNSNT